MRIGVDVDIWPGPAVSDDLALMSLVVLLNLNTFIDPAVIGDRALFSLGALSIGNKMALSD